MNLNEKVMKRIVIFGASGSGKTTAANKLGDITKIPVTHLDDIYHGPNWEELETKKFINIIKRIISREKWIIDGNYSTVRNYIIEKASLVLILKFPTYQVLWRLFWRTILRNTRLKLFEITLLPINVERSGNREKKIKTLTMLGKHSINFNFRRYNDILEELENYNVTRITFFTPKQLSLFLKQIQEYYQPI